MSIAEEKKDFSTKDIEENRMMAALSYLSIFCFISMIVKKESSFTQFHAKQGLALFIIEAIAVLLAGTIFLAWLSSIIFLGCIILSLLGIYHAMNGKAVELPIIKTIVHKLNL